MTDLLPYAEAHTSAPDPLRAEIARVTAERPDASMLSGPVKAELLAAFVHATQARLVLEVGTFTGYGSLTMAAAMAPGGRVVTCELDEANAALAQASFDRSDVGDRIDVRVGPAIDTIRALDGPIDVAYVDADKGGYVDYWEAIVPKLAPHGVLLADNTLWRGEVLAPASPDARAIAAFNEHALADPRMRVALLPFADGVTVAWRA
jgi:caffeoyl-CoA O-methyltransferase